MDEAQDLSLHRWLSLCRMLMIQHPRCGADYLASLWGESSRYRIGWNRVALGAHSSQGELFIFVSQDRGLTTPNRPDVPDEQIHDVDERYPELHATRAWQDATALAEKVAHSDISDWPAARVQGVMDSIEHAGRSDGITHDTEVLAQWMRAAVPRMGDAMQRANLHDFRAPVLDVVRAYLAFELPGMLARELLAVLLLIQRNIPHLGPPTASPPEARAHALEHLADQTYTLQKMRAGKRAGPYFELTYLLSLYGGTCAVLAGFAAESGRDERLAKVALNAEEIAAHHGPPAFALPAMFGPAETVAWLRSAAWEHRRPAEELAQFYCVYPPLQTSLAGGGDEEIDDHYRAFSAGQEPYDLLSALEEQLSPIAPANESEIMRGLLAMMIGREMMQQGG